MANAGATSETFIFSPPSLPCPLCSFHLYKEKVGEGGRKKGRIQHQDTTSEYSLGWRNHITNNIRRSMEKFISVLSYY